jgi:hypothetical protein
LAPISARFTLVPLPSLVGVPLVVLASVVAVVAGFPSVSSAGVRSAVVGGLGVRALRGDWERGLRMAARGLSRA